MSIKNELLSIARIGMEGTFVLASTTFTGKIIAVSLENIKLDTGDMDVCIELDSIVAYAFSKENNQKQEKHVAEATLFEDIFTNFIDKLNNCNIPEVVTLYSLKNEMKKKGTASGIVEQAISIIDYAYKVNEVSEDSDRLRRAYAIVSSGAETNNTDTDILRLKGILQHMLGRNADAVNTFCMAKDYNSAIALAGEQSVRIKCAFSLINAKSCVLYSIRVLLNEADKPLGAFKTLLYNIHSLEDEYSQNVFLASAYAWKRFSEKNQLLVWPVQEQLYSKENLGYLKSIYGIKVVLGQAAEETVTEMSEELSEFSYIDKSNNENHLYRGKICKYLEEKRCGFIPAHNVPEKITSGNIFFYFGQINDDRLREKLYELSAVGEEISFTLGINPRNNTVCADNIKLIGGGSAYSENNNEMKMSGNGILIEYNRFSAFGSILYDNDDLIFRLEAVSDPYLRAYLKTNTDAYDWPVKFDIVYGNGGKRYAGKIVSEKEFPRDKIDGWILNKEITPLEIGQWDHYQSTGEQSFHPVVLGNYQPLKAYDYLAIRDSDNFSVVEKKSTEHQKKNIEDSSAALQLVEEASGLYLQKSATADQLSEAVSKFQKALLQDDILYNNKKLDTAVLGLANIYLRLSNFTEAINILEKYRKDDRISHEKILNVLIQVYDKSKNSPSTLIELYKEAIQVSQKQNSRLHYLLRLATLEQIEKKYLDASDSYDSWLQGRKNMGDLGKNLTLENNVRQNFAICLYLGGEHQKAAEQAEIILKYNSDNMTAKKIINNEIIVDQEYNSLEFSEESSDNWLDTAESRHSKTDMEVSEFLNHCMDQIDLRSIVKRDIKDGVFIGPLPVAKSLVDQYSNTQRQTTYSRYNNLMAVAKLISQISDREEFPGNQLNKWHMTKQNAMQYAGRAIASMGDVLAEDMEAPEDSILYMYQTAMNLLRNPDSPTKAEQDWVNSFMRCLKLFFSSRYEFKTYVSKQNTSNAKDRLSIASFYEKKSQHSIDELTVEIMQMVNAIRKDSWSEKLIVAYYEAFVSEDVISFLSGNNDVSGYKGRKQFNKLMNEAIERMENDAERIEHSMDKCLMCLFTNLRYEEAVSQLQELSKTPFLNHLDRERLSQIIDVLRLLNEYNSEVEFEKRAEILSDSISRIQKMCQMIERYPSRLSFHIFLQRLYRLTDAVLNKKRELYNEYKPNLELIQNEYAAYKDDLGRIRVQCSIHNLQGHQMADNVRFMIRESNHLHLHGSDNKTSDIKGVRGGETEGIILTVELKEEYLEIPVCDLEIQVLYEYNDENAETVKEILSPRIFTLNLYNKDDFSPIKNPYSGKTEGVMKSDSMFYGRTDFINRLVNSIKGTDGGFNKGHAVALYGQTRAGKSSILYHCKKAIRQCYGDSVILADCGSLGTSENEYTIYYKMIDSIYNEILDHHAKLMESERLRKMEPIIEDILLHPPKASDYIIPFMSCVQRTLEQCDEEKIVVLLIDEFAYLRKWIDEGKISQEFMKFWKGIMQDYAIYAIVVGQDNMPLFKVEYQNEFSSMELEQVTYLDRENAIKLMDEPIMIDGKSRYREEALDRLYELTAGSAFLILKLCDALVEYLNETASAFISRALLDEFIRKRVLPQKGQKGCVDKVTFEAQIQDRAYPGIDEENIEILLEVARNSRITGYAEISKIHCKNMTVEEQEKLFNRLVERNVLEKEKNRFCRIVVQLLKEWLLYTYGDEE